MGRPEFEQVVAQIKPKSIRYISGESTKWSDQYETEIITFQAPPNTLVRLNSFRVHWESLSGVTADKQIVLKANNIAYFKALGNMSQKLYCSFTDFFITKTGFDMVDGTSIDNTVPEKSMVPEVTRGIIFDEVNPLELHFTHSLLNAGSIPKRSWDFQFILEEVKDIGVSF